MSPPWSITDAIVPPINRGGAGAAVTYLISSVSVTRPTFVTPAAYMAANS
jgi:hypothetical protein